MAVGVLTLDANTRNIARSLLDQAKRAQLEDKGHYDTLASLSAALDENDELRGELAVTRHDAAQKRRALTVAERRVAMLGGEILGVRRQLDLERRKTKRLQARVNSLLSVGKKAAA